jgi:hypothetical protein
MTSSSSQRKRLLPNEDKYWDRTVPVAIGPNWLRTMRFRVEDAGDSMELAALRVLNRYMIAVENWRGAKDSMPEKGTRSLRATALECVIGAMPWIEEGIGELPRILIERLWGEFNRRLVSSCPL